MTTPTDTPTPRKYYDTEGNETTLLKLVRIEPEWAVNQILHRDILERELIAANARCAELEAKVVIFERDWMRASTLANEREAQLSSATSELEKARAEVERLRKRNEELVAEIDSCRAKALSELLSEREKVRELEAILDSQKMPTPDWKAGQKKLQRIIKDGRAVTSGLEKEK